MNYEEKYKSALKWIKTIFAELSCEQRMEAEAFFPELAESEDESIRKELIAFLKENLETGGRADETWSISGLERWIAWLERQGEQKPTTTMERKFNIGDWVATNISFLSSPLKIVDASDTEYRIEDVNGSSGVPKTNYFDKKYHFWSIQDAKDGDVLVASDGSIFLYKGVVDCACKYYAALTVYNDIKINTDEEGGYWETSKAVHPATKEQCDLLFKAIKDAGYKWNDDKKKLEITDWSKHITSKIDGSSPITVESADEDEPSLEIHPKFKVGDKIVIKDVIGGVEITEITDTQYGTVTQFGTQLFFDINVLDSEAHYAVK